MINYLDASKTNHNRDFENLHPTTSQLNIFQGLHRRSLPDSAAY